MKLLSGSELAGFIKERQLRQVRALEGRGIKPKLAIVQLKDDPVIDTYISLKQRYGSDIGIEVERYQIEQTNAIETISELNRDESVHGIIVQLPIENSDQQDEILNSVSPEKDVDGLADNSPFDPATPTAILWLLAGFNVDLRGKKIVIVGRGALVGKPLTRILKLSGHEPEVVDRSTKDIDQVVETADILITATGSPALITSKMIKQDAVVVDAGVAVEAGVARGDLEVEVYERTDLTITPVRGGVGPLTVCALFENVIKASS